MYRKLRYLALALAPLILGACTHDDDPEMPTPYEVIDIVTYLGETSTGMDLGLVGRDGSQRVLSAEVQFKEGPAIGTRLLVQYQCALADTVLRPTPVTLLGVASIPFDTVQAKPMTQISALPPGRMSVVSQWVTGPYVNINAMVDYSGEPRSYNLVADAATLDADTLQCYLYLVGEEPGANSIARNSYGSFYLGKLPRDPAKPLKVNVVQ